MFHALLVFLPYSQVDAILGIKIATLFIGVGLIINALVFIALIQLLLSQRGVEFHLVLAILFASFYSCVFQAVMLVHEKALRCELLNSPKIVASIIMLVTE
jgi:hypothetical protein